MTKAQNHFYILVFTEDGPIYVTKINHNTRYAQWDKTETPREVSKSVADDIAIGLNLNGYLACVVVSKWEIEKQPYRYVDGKLVWVNNEKEER